MASRIVISTCLAIAAVLALGPVGTAQKTPDPVVPAIGLSSLNGIWLADEATRLHDTLLRAAWNSTFSLKDGTFDISHFEGLSSNLTGTFTIDAASKPAKIDLNIDEKDLSEQWPALKYPRCTLPGICTLDGDRLVICFQFGANPQRPRDFASLDSSTVVLSLVRASSSFSEFPKDVTVTVVDEKNKPVLGARVFRNMMRSFTRGGLPDEWRYLPQNLTGADGTTTLKYADLEQRCFIGAHDGLRALTGLTMVSPASLAFGRATVKLLPDCLLSGELPCEVLDKQAAGQDWKLRDSRPIHLNCGGREVGTDLSPFTNSYRFQFYVPPGVYTLEAYGNKVQRKYVDVVIPPGMNELNLPPIPLESLPTFSLAGKPAPEFEGIVAWRGTPTKLADLRGKYILVDFWGYWCGPCVHAMPWIIDLHRQFADKGLAILSVHEDDEGEIDSAAKLDEKIDALKKKFWKGEDLPFPVALMSGKKIAGAPGSEPRSIGPINQYGIQYLPTLILIDKEGKFVGEFQGVDFDDHEPGKKMFEAVKKLLGQ